MTDAFHDSRSLNLPLRVWQTLRWPLAAFIGSRLLLFVTGAWAQSLLSERPGGWHAAPELPLLDMWARWDSGFYLDIATTGYSYLPGEQSSVAFFPLYPLLVKLFAWLTGPVAAGVLVSNLCFLLALVCLYELTRLELSERAARRSVWLLSLFPASFFFSAVYTESLFLLLALASFYAARSGRWGLASLASLLAGATRVVGVLLVLPLGLLWLRAQGWTLARVHKPAAWQSLAQGLRRDFGGLLCIVTVPLGLLSYMVFLARQFAEPWAFARVQAAWGRELSSPFIVLQNDLSQFYRGLDVGELYWQVPLDLSALLLGLALLPFIWRRLGAAYGVFVLSGLLLPLSSSTQSLLRYLTVLFPVFMLLGELVRRRWVVGAVYGVFGGGLSVLFALFVNWYFVA